MSSDPSRLGLGLISVTFSQGVHRWGDYCVLGSFVFYFHYHSLSFLSGPFHSSPSAALGLGLWLGLQD